MASRLGKLEIYLSSTTTGLPIPSATIDIRRQGAQIVSGGPTVFTINNPGAIRHSSETGAPSSDSCICYKADGTVRDANIRAVTALSATSITVATGFTATADDDRISPVSNLPIIYEDSEGTTSIASSRLTTDANGYAAAWAPGGNYDAVVNPDNTIGQPTQYTITDLEARGADDLLSNGWAGNGFNRDTLRDFAAADVLYRLRVRGSVKFQVMGDGEIVAGVSGATHNLTGSLTVTGGILGNDLQSVFDTVVGGQIEMSTAASRLVPGATSFAVRNTGDTLDNLLVLEAGDVTARRDLDGRRLYARAGTDVVAGDFSLHANWGVGAAVTIINSGSNDTSGRIRITSGTGTGANPSCTLTFKDGAYSPNGPTGLVVRESIGDQVTIPFTVSGNSTTVVFTFQGTPTASTSYDIAYFVVGK